MQSRLENIKVVAKKAGFEESDIFCYGNYIAKVNPKFNKKQGKLVLVTAMTSNKSGIGKTTISIGLADALNMLGKRLCLHFESLRLAQSLASKVVQLEVENLQLSLRMKSIYTSLVIFMQ